MRNILQPVLSLLLLVSAVPMILLFSAEKSFAPLELCRVTFVKFAPGASDDLLFEFDGVEEGFVVFTVTVGSSESPGLATGTVTEAPQHGYKFGGLECEPWGGYVITDVTENDWSAECVNPNLETFCTITNIPESSAIPTLNEWGMIAAAVGLGLIGLFYGMRRKRAAL